MQASLRGLARGRTKGTVGLSDKLRSIFTAARKHKKVVGHTIPVSGIDTDILKHGNTNVQKEPSIRTGWHSGCAARELITWAAADADWLESAAARRHASCVHTGHMKQSPPVDDHQYSRGTAPQPSIAWRPARRTEAARASRRLPAVCARACFGIRGPR